jgi:hypothetical protein
MGHFGYLPRKCIEIAWNFQNMLGLQRGDYGKLFSPISSALREICTKHELFELDQVGFWGSSWSRAQSVKVWSRNSTL